MLLILLLDATQLKHSLADDISVAVLFLLFKTYIAYNVWSLWAKLHLQKRGVFTGMPVMFAQRPPELHVSHEYKPIDLIVERTVFIEPGATSQSGGNVSSVMLNSR